MLSVNITLLFQDYYKLRTLKRVPIRGEKHHNIFRMRHCIFNLSYVMFFYFLTTFFLGCCSCDAFAPNSSSRIDVIQSSQLSKSKLQAEKKKGGVNFFTNFFEELDAFVDDATNRRLGNGAAFYGKRKSSFYGEEDFMKKNDKTVPDPTEDYQGPAKAGYFQWMMDEETGQMKPVTRMKKVNIERNPKFWDKVFKESEE